MTEIRYLSEPTPWDENMYMELLNKGLKSIADTYLDLRLQDDLLLAQMTAFKPKHGDKFQTMRKQRHKIRELIHDLNRLY